MGRPCGSGLETTQHFQEIVLRVRRKRVSSRVDADARSTRNIIVEPHVRRFRLIELHVPVAVRRYLFAQLLPQPHLGECGAVGWKRSGWECSRTWITLDREREPCTRAFHFRRNQFSDENSNNKRVLKKRIFSFQQRLEYWQNFGKRYLHQKTDHYLLLICKA